MEDVLVILQNHTTGSEVERPLATKSEYVDMDCVHQNTAGFFPYHAFEISNNPNMNSFEALRR